jgi:enoyl-CoA hydratase/carnithine racemase
MDGHEAVRIGLANRVVPEGSLAAEAGKIAAAVAGWIRLPPGWRRCW